MSEEPTTRIEPAPATYDAPPYRSSRKELLDAIAFCAHHPMIDVILQSFGSVLAVLNEHRQIIALNGAALELLGEAYLRGRVDFVSSGDAGTTFRLWLPGPPAAT